MINHSNKKTMKKLLLTALLFAAGSGTMFAQKYITRTAKISFNASAPNSPEKIEAINNEVANILDAGTGDMIFQVLVKSFKFERALMQEHFNENYMESDKLPKADFRGKVVNISEVNFKKDGTYKTTVAGKLTIHGVTNDVVVPGTITIKGTAIKLNARFAVKLKDYKIDVPSVVADKIGNEAQIALESELTQK
jgi:hypothetical protein